MVADRKAKINTPASKLLDILSGSRPTSYDKYLGYKIVGMLGPDKYLRYIHLPNFQISSQVPDPLMINT